MRNDVVLCWHDDEVDKPSHFKLREFANRDGLVMVDPSLVQSLELTRRSLGDEFSRDVQILITSGIRTVVDNERLAVRFGWTDEGGLVARDSRHLVKYGGIAADLFAVYCVDSARIVVDQAIVASACRRYFVYVKADYADGHVHADNRTG